MPDKRRQGKAWLILAALIAPLPSALKRPIYRHVFGYRIGSGVRIGLSAIVVGQCSIGDGTRIGHGNLFIHSESLSLGNLVSIGFGNIVRGGRHVRFDDRSQVMRFNEINSIIDAEKDAGDIEVSSDAGRFILGWEGVITAQHKIDFTGGVTLGRRAILGGRLSSLWTHNRQADGPIFIGDRTYMGSGIQMVPGSGIGEACVVGIGSVVTKLFADTRVLIGGNPAKVIKPLSETNQVLVDYPTRPDLEPEAMPNPIPGA